MAEYKTNKEKCISCGACIATCPEGMEWDDDGKSRVRDSGKVEQCGGETICPYAAIEKTG